MISTHDDLNEPQKKDSTRFWKDYEECWQRIFILFPMTSPVPPHHIIDPSPRLPALTWEIENQHQKRGNERISYGFMKLEGGPAQLGCIKITHSWVQVWVPILLVIDACWVVVKDPRTCFACWETERDWSRKSWRKSMYSWHHPGRNCKVLKYPEIPNLTRKSQTYSVSFRPKQSTDWEVNQFVVQTCLGWKDEHEKGMEHKAYSSLFSHLGQIEGRNN